jgi:hypothetical protein
MWRLVASSCRAGKADTTMLLKRTWNVALLLVAGIGTVGVGLTSSAPAASQDDADVAAKIESAVSAAPLSISDNARSGCGSNRFEPREG